MAVSTLNRCSVALSAQNRVKSVVPARSSASKLRVAPIVAFRDNKRSGSQSSKGGKTATASRTGKKQPLIQPLGKAVSNRKEEGESVLWGVAVFGLFVTGVLFVTIPAFQVGGTSFTQSWQKGVNKSAGIKEPPTGTANPGYAPGPGPAAAPESPAARM